MRNIQLIQLSTQELLDLINTGFKEQIQDLKKELLEKRDRDELLNREATSALLDIDLSTLARWTKEGKLRSYGISGRRYYMRSEILESLKHSKK